MTLGQVVDYCEAWNARNINEKSGDLSKDTNTTKKPKYRDATQADWDAFWG